LFPFIYERSKRIVQTSRHLSFAALGFNAISVQTSTMPHIYFKYKQRSAVRKSDHCAELRSASALQSVLPQFMDICTTREMNDQIYNSRNA